MTLQELLAQALGMGSDEPVRLADGPPSYRTRGQLPVAPIAQRMASLPARQPPRFQEMPREQPFPFMTPTVRVPAPQPPRSSMAAYPHFADYANAELGLQTASGMAAPPPVWQDPNTGALANPTRFPGPASSPAPMPGADHGAALMAALQNARANPEPVISPDERARALWEEQVQLGLRRPALYPAWTRRGGPQE